MSEVTRNASAQASKGIEWLARIGYAAKGVVYAVVGILAALAAFGSGGQTTGTKGAVTRIGSEPFGQVLLAVIALGLLGYVVWRLTQTFMDPEHEGNNPGGLAKRAAFLSSGIIYAILTAYTVSLMLGSGGGGGGHSKDDLTAKLMAHEGGIWAVAAIGIIIVGVGISQFMRAYKEKFKKKWSTGHMSRVQETWATRAAKWGLSARGVVFLIIGGFLIAGALQADPSKATGLGGALNKLAQQSFGPWLLGFVALGLVCYGIYCLINAIYRRINP